jgi:dienelactone hydrolase/predicted small lipoprotein YifL
MRLYFNLMALAVVMVFSLAACGNPQAAKTPTPAATATPADTPTPTTISTATYTPFPIQTLSSSFGEKQQIDIYTEDRFGLRLALWFYPPDRESEKNLAVLLGHESGATYWNWNTLAVKLAEDGYPVFSLEFRGHGASDGILSYPDVGIDVRTAVDYINAVGYNRVVCIGASMGGSGCMAAAKDVELAGLGMLSSPMNIPGTHLVSWEDLETLTMPKWFVIAEADLVINEVPNFVNDFIEMAERTPEPKRLDVYPGVLHGTALFWGPDGEEIKQIFFDFIDGIAQGE